MEKQADTQQLDEKTLQEEKERRIKERKEEQKKAEEKLDQDTKQLFNTLAKYLQSELLATSDDYKLLQQMNAIERDKYVEMTKLAQTLVTNMGGLQEKCT
eukprot:TRINITY_DN2465_c0_g1_i1.p1 TRINITY_DN2465_c0_g1~~TRINITY_DN2465_c0_g1_i1.p1  ORF type:complete len:107 (-),score=29.70 TRINITY_DN2465_c0_g1_i1:367-666(-)